MATLEESVLNSGIPHRRERIPEDASLLDVVLPGFYPAVYP
jgi:hypothetical protein